MSKLRILIASAISFFVYVECYSQSITGIVVDKNEQPIPYVSIGIVNGNNGTISDENGAFHIDLRNSKEREILRFSCVGYHIKDFNVSSFKKDKIIKVVLKEKKYSLDEVIITPDKAKTIEFGKLKSHHGGWALGGVHEGFEIARSFTNKTNICLNEFSFHLSRTDYDSILFRLHFYSYNNGEIGEHINRTQILINSKTKKGWISKDLLPYNIIVNSNFLVSIEVINGWKNSIQCNEDILITGGNSYGVTYTRGASLGSWETNTGQMDYYVLGNILTIKNAQTHKNYFYNKIFNAFKQ